MFLIESPPWKANRAGDLIAEKLAIPSLTPGTSRPRLLALLERSLNCGTSTIISGRAGTGKTLLALDFARRCGRAVSWYKVDAPEGEMNGFFQYLIASIRKERPNFGSKTWLPLLSKSDAAQIATVAEAFVYELTESDSGPLLIVIDDLHLVCDSEWLVPFFRRLLPLLPSNVHMLITSRTMPPAPLWRMRSKQTLSVIEEEELAFTREEAIDLFESYGLHTEQATIALDHTHGRAAALAQCAETLNSSDNSSENSEQILAVRSA